jgi:hypothetical protein
MSDQLCIDYRPSPDVSPEQEAEILASIYRFLLARHAKKVDDEGRPESKGGANETLEKAGGESSRQPRRKVTSR